MPRRYRAGDLGIGGRYWCGSTPHSWSRHASRSARNRPSRGGSSRSPSHMPFCRTAHHELGVVAQGRETGARCDQIAGDGGGMLIARHAKAIDQKSVQCLVIRQPASFNLVADDRSEHVEAAVDVAVHRAGEGGDDRALGRCERVARPDRRHCSRSRASRAHRRATRERGGPSAYAAGDRA